MSITPFAWKERPSLIERILPAQKISAELYKENMAGTGKTLTALGSYWKGRKPLILVKACVLGLLLPASDDPEADLAIFEKLMAVDDEAFVRRNFTDPARRVFDVLLLKRRVTETEARKIFAVRVRELNSIINGRPRVTYRTEPFSPDRVSEIDSDGARSLIWNPQLDPGQLLRWQVEYVRCHDYLTRVSRQSVRKSSTLRNSLDRYGKKLMPIWAQMRKASPS